MPYGKHTLPHDLINLNSGPKTGEKVKRTQDLHKEEGSKGGKERKQLLTREVSNSTHLLQKNNQPQCGGYL